MSCDADVFSIPKCTKEVRASHFSITELIFLATSHSREANSPVHASLPASHCIFSQCTTVPFRPKVSSWKCHLSTAPNNDRCSWPPWELPWTSFSASSLTMRAKNVPGALRGSACPSCAGDTWSWWVSDRFLSCWIRPRWGAHWPRPTWACSHFWETRVHLRILFYPGLAGPCTKTMAVSPASSLDSVISYFSQFPQGPPAWQGYQPPARQPTELNSEPPPPRPVPQLPKGQFYSDRQSPKPHIDWAICFQLSPWPSGTIASSATPTPHTHTHIHTIAP